MMQIRVLAAIGMATLASAGCGESSAPAQDTDRASASAQAYVDGFRNQNAEAVCEVVTEQAQRQIVSERPSAGDDCVEVLSAVFEQAPVQDFAQDAKLRPPRMSGDRATVIATSPALQPGQRTVIALVEVDGQWKVDVAAGGVEPPD